MHRNRIKFYVCMFFLIFIINGRVMASKNIKKIGKSNLNKIIITNEVLQKNHYYNILELLEDVSGIFVETPRSYFGDNLVSSNGLNYRSNAIFLDGIRVDINNQVPNIPLSAVDKVIVTKNANTAKCGYGGNGVIIEIFTKESKKLLNFLISSAHGTSNINKNDIFISKKFKNFSILSNYTTSKFKGDSSLVEDDNYADSYEKDNYDVKSYLIKLGANYDNHSISFIGLRNDSNEGLDLLGPDSEDYMDEVDNFYSINYLNKNKYGAITIGRNFSEVKHKNYIKFMDSTQEAVYKNIKDYIGYKKSYFNNKSNFGVDIEKNKSTYSKVDEKYNYFTLKLSDNNLFYNDKIFIEKNLSFSKFNNNLENKINYYLAATYFFDNKISVKGVISKGYNLTPLSDRYENIFGNNKIKDEEIKHNSFEIDFSNLMVRYFQNKIKNEIYYDDRYYEPYVNREKEIKTSGFEFSYTEELLKDLNVKFYYMFLNSFQGDLKREGIVKNSYGVKTSYEFSKQFNVNINFKQTGAKEEYDPVKQKYVQLGNYMVSNMVINYNYNSKINLFLKANNIWDEDYEIMSYNKGLEQTFLLGLKIEI